MEAGPKKARQSHNNKVPPDAPRRNLSSFVMFANARRKELKEQYPDRPYPKIQSDISFEWDKLDDEGKSPWKRAMVADKERYKKEMELYRKYGPGWVWVMGHHMRQDLGLTDEDCTKLEFIPSALGPGVSYEPAQREQGADYENFSNLRRAISEVATRESQTRSPRTEFSTVYTPHPTHTRTASSPQLGRDISYINTISHYGFPTPVSLYGETETTRVSARNNAEELYQTRTQLDNPGIEEDGCPVSYFDEQLYYHNCITENILSPTVFDGFGFEIPWANTYQWEHE
ncbi:hypothetical protein ABW20_dc0101422 [Dactylellina cionopaga]|nr:hypothetical protein ABW20_dc0101422 [Dactylellina cionopaga]